MKFVFLFLGKTRERYLDQGIQDYAGRLGRFVQTEIVVLKEKHNRNSAADVVKRCDADLLLERCQGQALKVALDPGGRDFTSEELAALFSAWEDRGVQTVNFLLGGHLGLHERVRQQADLVLSLSRLTFTHEMSRLILLEQLYRGCMINAGRNYHN
ncbi:ribosomal RNA large subunit methyltransferase H [bacterium BMS3Bbin14]|nr:ribosomal RNA large subunit methyltransferase H [bacterium BMS3Bbin14]